MYTQHARLNCSTGGLSPTTSSSAATALHALHWHSHRSAQHAFESMMMASLLVGPGRFVKSTSSEHHRAVRSSNSQTALSALSVDGGVQWHWWGGGTFRGQILCPCPGEFYASTNLNKRGGGGLSSLGCSMSKPGSSALMNGILNWWFRFANRLTSRSLGKHIQLILRWSWGRKFLL